jgi:muconate cycloisomerase
MRTVQQVEIFPVRLPVTRTFTFASGSAGASGQAAPFVFVKLTDTEGETGWGAVRPMPTWSYETFESLVTTLRHYFAPQLVGLPITDLWGLHRVLHRMVGRGPSTGQPNAKAALDMAFYDLSARAAGLTLRSYLGGSDDRNILPLSYTLTAHDVTALRDDIAQGRSAGFVHFNFKAAVAPATDIAIAQIVKDLTSGFVWADANQGFTLQDARRVTDAFYEIGVDVLEQPLPADQIGLHRALRQHCKLPLAVDEASVSPADFFHYAANNLVDYLVVKLPRSGGIFPTLQQIGVAHSAGLDFLVSGLTGSFITKLAACQVALAFGSTRPAALNGSQFIDESMLYPTKAQIESAGAIHLNNEPGVGIHPDDSALRELIDQNLNL